LAASRRSDGVLQWNPAELLLPYIAGHEVLSIHAFVQRDVQPIIAIAKRITTEGSTTNSTPTSSFVLQIFANQSSDQNGESNVNNNNNTTTNNNTNNNNTNNNATNSANSTSSNNSSASSSTSNMTAATSSYASSTVSKHTASASSTTAASLQTPSSISSSSSSSSFTPTAPATSASGQSNVEHDVTASVLEKLIRAGSQRIELDYVPFKISHIPYLSFPIEAPSSTSTSAAPATKTYCTQHALLVSGNDGLHVYRQLTIDTQGYYSNADIEYMYTSTWRSPSAPPVAPLAVQLDEPVDMSRYKLGEFAEIPLSCVIPEVSGVRLDTGASTLAATGSSSSSSTSSSSSSSSTSFTLSTFPNAVSATGSSADIGAPASVAVAAAAAAAAGIDSNGSGLPLTLEQEEQDDWGIVLEPSLPASLLGAIIEQDPSISNNLLLSLTSRTSATPMYSFDFQASQVAVSWDVRSMGHLRVSAFACQDGSLHLFVADTHSKLVQKKVTWLDAPLSSATLFTPSQPSKPPLMRDVPLNQTKSQYGMVHQHLDADRHRCTRVGITRESLV
jgi:hypothetical protein